MIRYITHYPGVDAERIINYSASAVGWRIATSKLRTRLTGTLKGCKLL